MNEDPYKLHAKYYDAAYDSKVDLVDLPFYVEEIAKFEGSVLEIGCGTGRITKKIAELGRDIVGVDYSESMLEILGISLEKSDLKERISLAKGDLRELQINRKFSTIILPFRVLQHMYTLEDQLKAFRSLEKHLEDDGRVIFDVFYPRFDFVYSGVGEPKEELSWTTEDGRSVTRTFIKDSFDKIDQSFDGRFIYRTFDDGECIKEETTKIRMVCYTVPHIRLLLNLSGLKILESFGTFARTPLDNTSKEIIIVAGKNGCQQVASGQRR